MALDLAPELGEPRDLVRLEAGPLAQLRRHLAQDACRRRAPATHSTSFVPIRARTSSRVTFDQRYESGVTSPPTTVTPSP